MGNNYYQNNKYHIYLPKDDTKPNTLGEKWFFAGKFWKLQVMMGYWWSDNTITKRGFSLFNICINKNIENIINKLNSLGIEYNTNISEAGWQYRINISAKKRNIELINKLYENFYNEMISTHSGWVRYKNEIMDMKLRNDKDVYFSEKPDECFEII